MPPAIFALVILKIGSHFLPKLAWIITLLFYTLPTIMGRQAGDATPSFFFFFFFFLPDLASYHDSYGLSLPRS
jgi:hypothetical protein